MESKKLPDPVLAIVKSSISRIQLFNRRIEEARSLDRRMGGNGRYETDAWKNYGGFSAGQDDLRQLDRVRQLAPQNGVDFDFVLQELGFEPITPISQQAKEWF